MTALLLFLSATLVAPAAAQADPRHGWCSAPMRGQVQCIRPAHFSYDLCQQLQGIEARHGLDRDFFTRLIWQESRFDANALSPANAQGIAQFIPGTAALRALPSPYNPADALEASAAYLAELSRRFGNLGLAAAAYNAGEARTERFVAGLSRLPAETVAYVRIITGLEAETWRDAPPEKVDMRLNAAMTFRAACAQLAAKRRITPLARPEPPRAAWGVQLAFGRTEAAARASFTRKTAACRAVLGKEHPQMIPVRNRVSGRQGYVMARIGRPDAAAAHALCTRLSRAGCFCAVYRNQ